ncbi:MAG: OmpA family protein [Fimbriimonadaceae bacterium]
MRLIQNCKKLAEKGDVQLQSTVDGLLIELIENETTGEVFFELGSAAVRPEAEKMFSMIGEVLAKAKRPIEIEGHTDALPYPGAGYDNFDLSGDRAQSVRRILQRGGVRNSQIVSIDAKGSTEPRLPENPRHFSNRRVTILLPYNLVKGPGVKLPLDVTDHSVEGMASLPKNIRPDRVDLKSKGTPDNHQPEATSDSSHDTGH